jgi:hypothetical protein
MRQAASHVNVERPLFGGLLGVSSARYGST